MVLAYVLRYRLQWFIEVLYDAPYSAYLPFNALFSLGIPLILWANASYENWRVQAWLDQVFHVAGAVVIAVTVVLAASFVIRPLVYSRLLILEGLVFMILLMALARGVVRLVLRYLRRKGIGVKRVVIVGAGEVGRRVMRTVVARPDLGYQIVGYVDDNPNKGEGEIGRFKGLGSLDGLPAAIEDEAVDEVIITLPWTYHRRILNVLRECARRDVMARLVPDLFQMSLSRVEVSDLGGVPLVEIREIAFSRVALIAKRAMDFTGAALALILGWPLFLLIAVAIKLDSPGPIFFRQRRVGKNGEPFDIYKFRSMRTGADAEKANLSGLNDGEEALFKIRDDPRVTRVGRLLRQTSLDELPQFFNVLRGEMSLVGPRPQIPAEVAQYQPWHRRRLSVPPGITGMWQISGRSDLSFDEMVLLDLYYIEHWTPWLDFTILLRTVPKVLMGKGAY
jgi:exopolysaccharide biosynthesis polyprenyl glycosylphosphotransferase